MGILQALFLISRARPISVYVLADRTDCNYLSTIIDYGSRRQAERLLSFLSAGYFE